MAVVDITACRACARLRHLLDLRDAECSACLHRRQQAFDQETAQARLSTMARHNAVVGMLVAAALVVAGVALIAMAVAR